MRNKQKGFSLIELLIVVAIILIIAAIAIPNLLRSRMAANEASAVGSLRTLNTSLVTYSSNCPNLGFAADLPTLGGTAGDCTAAGLIDDVLAAGAKSGYDFTYTPTDPGTGRNETYTLLAAPSVQGTTGQRQFFTDQTGVIRFTTDGSAADVNSPPIS